MSMGWVSGGVLVMRNALWGEEFQTDQIPLFTSLPGGPDVSNANHHVLESGPGLQADGMY
jgi:hypothetical protein